MTQQTITTLFYASFLIMGLGIFLMIKYIIRRFPALMNKVNRDADRSGRVSTSAVGMRTLLVSIPGILIMILFCIPTFYLSNLSQRFDYCVEMFRVNKSVGISKDDPDVRERCQCLDLDEVRRTAEEN